MLSELVALLEVGLGVGELVPSAPDGRNSGGSGAAVSPRSAGGSGTAAAGRVAFSAQLTQERGPGGALHPPAVASAAELPFATQGLQTGAVDQRGAVVSAAPVLNLRQLRRDLIPLGPGL
ncbi:MAG: hypothetical protein NTW51_16425, partial [Cyanobacteria bacterium]|nr:hypothetical protein [Cyanobacteriota bacterium]